MHVPFSPDCQGLIVNVSIAALCVDKDMFKLDYGGVHQKRQLL